MPSSQVVHVQSISPIFLLLSGVAGPVAVEHVCLSKSLLSMLGVLSVPFSLFPYDKNCNRCLVNEINVKKLVVRYLLYINPCCTTILIRSCKRFFHHVRGRFLEASDFGGSACITLSFIPNTSWPCIPSIAASADSLLANLA